ncbi:MAG: hypothetical protein RIC95_08740 [Vicingaceae bacterium]
MSKIIASTEELNNGKAHYVGFHDICPWNQENQLLAVHQADKDDVKDRTKNDYISIAIWNPKSKEINIIDKTNCWNWQQGSRLQWIPSSDKLIFNKRKGNQAVAQIYSTKDAASEKTIDWPIYELHPNGKKAISYSFARLGELWKGYGYAGLEAEPDQTEIAPDKNGIFEIDLENNERKLLISLKQTFNLNRNARFDAFKRFFTHCAYNPSGSKFCFFERFHTSEGALYSRFFVANSDGSNLKLVSEGKQSHFDWCDDDHLLIWSRPSKSLMNVAHKMGVLSKPPFKQVIKIIRSLSPSLKSKVTNEHYRIIDVTNKELDQAVAKEIVKEDGHPMFTQDRSCFVNDTYPNSEGKQELMLIKMKDHSKESLAWFDVPKKFQDNDLKCDLHPRWDRKDAQVCIDSSHSGKRQVYIIEADS